MAHTIVEFSDEWFHDEVRSGFYVDSLQKCAWAAQIEVLMEIDGICKRNHIKWFADWGTLLGAIRHAGFIPWDDDIDICMLREDYEQFRKVVEHELPEGYVVCDRRKGGFEYFLLRIWNTEYSAVINPDWINKYHSFPFQAGIDIFPLDYICSDPTTEQMRKDIVRELIYCVKLIEMEGETSEYINRLIDQVEELLRVKLIRSKPLKPQILDLIENMFQLFTRDEAAEVAYMQYWIERDECAFPLHAYRETAFLPFETIKVPVPIGFDDVLRVEYGDYSKMIKGGSDHDFPYYSKMELAFSKDLGLSDGELPYRYKVKSDDYPLIPKRRISSKNKEKREVVFLPFKSACWKSLEPFYNEEMADENCEVYVIPVPWYNKYLNGTIGEIHFDELSYPENVHLTKLNEYNIKERQPSKIYIQNPYDEYNFSYSVYPLFYARELRRHTNQLVYVPYFVPAEVEINDELGYRAMSNYVTVPGVITSDVTFVHSEKMRKSYIRRLTEDVGEETREIWEEKIRVNPYFIVE